ncbi:hypothetical protein C7I87_11900 [Mesorhizobium sp. SARCC-RB16n]|nr:hypothetical protein C7I87_11900 [Mesorhizobium sp. SARCC-RB16n]
MATSSPFVSHPFCEPAGLKYANLCQIFLALGQMVKTDDFKISTVCGMIMLATRQLPLAIGMTNDQCDTPLCAKDVATYKSSGFRHWDHQLRYI